MRLAGVALKGIAPGCLAHRKSDMGNGTAQEESSTRCAPLISLVVSPMTTFMPESAENVTYAIGNAPARNREMP
jgi:hypothetical protein